jgi:hypothetical protein
MTLASFIGQVKPLVFFEANNAFKTTLHMNHSKALPASSIDDNRLSKIN